MEGVRAAMKTKHLEADQWLNRKEWCWVPEEGDSCHKTGKIDRSSPFIFVSLQLLSESYS
jgi:hypothetical protein